jgi:hypothetical protein
MTTAITTPINIHCAQESDVGRARKIPLGCCQKRPLVFIKVNSYLGALLFTQAAAWLVSGMARGGEVKKSQVSK